jgi:hypothetical protein
MSEYYPDKWQIVKITGNGKSHYRVFANWHGGYTTGDSWKLNSGITAVTLDNNHYHFAGTSGSLYVCHRDRYGSTAYGSGVLNNLISQGKSEGIEIEVLPCTVNPLELNYDDQLA